MKSFAATTLILVSGMLLIGTVGFGIQAQGHSMQTITRGQAYMPVKELASVNFNKEVLQAKQPVLVDFYATWCGPCQLMMPVVEKISEAFGGKIEVVRVDVNKNPELSAKYGIDAIPTVKIFKNGAIVDGSLGLVSEEDLSKKLSKLL